MPAEAQPPSGKGSSFSEWVRKHDESRVFLVLYIGLAVVLSIWIGLFWLIAVVAVHGLLEVLKQREIDPTPGSVALRVLWELKLDLALVLFALVMTVYMETVLGLAGLSGAARAGAKGGARLLAWQKALRGVALSVDDAAQVAVAIARRRSGQEPASARSHQPTGWSGRWGLGDKVSVSLGALCTLLLLAAPLFTEHSHLSLLFALGAELHPFPG